MIGERIRLAREASRMTQAELGALVGLDQGQISAIEMGRQGVSPDLVESVAAATQYPVGFFTNDPLPDFPEGHYRRRTKGSSKESKQIRAQARQLSALVASAGDSVPLPEVVIRPIRDLEGPRQIEEVAANARASLGLGAIDAISNVIRAVERAGVLVVRLPAEMSYHDGYSAWPNYGLGGRPILAIGSGKSGDRDRFTVAHELGHLLLHTLRLDTDPPRAEMEANRFAGAFLLPRQVAIVALQPPLTLRMLMGVKAQYGTSIAMAIGRAHDLQLITASDRTSLHKQLATRRWTKQEPVEVPSERPSVLPTVLARLAGQGSRSERAARVGMPLFAYHALTT
ncbi:MAG: helix-turn-helix domain-containing protein [Candidatus Dormibacteria bacterium]